MRALRTTFGVPALDHGAQRAGAAAHTVLGTGGAPAAAVAAVRDAAPQRALGEPQRGAAGQVPQQHQALVSGMAISQTTHDTCLHHHHRAAHRIAGAARAPQRLQRGELQQFAAPEAAC
eukprot:6056623-Prymnesium_polylepis.1